MLARYEDSAPTLALESGGVNAAEGLLTARFFMFSQVYVHRVRDVYDGHLIRFLRSNLKDGGYPKSTSAYLGWDDPRVLELIKRKVNTDHDARAIIERKHFRSVYEFTPGQLGQNPTLADSLHESLKGFGDSILIRNSSKDAVVLEEGDVLVVDPLTDEVEDIMQRSTTLQTFKGIWYLRVYSDDENRTEVLNVVKQLIAGGSVG